MKLWCSVIFSFYFSARISDRLLSQIQITMECWNVRLSMWVKSVYSYRRVVKPFSIYYSLTYGKHQSTKCTLVAVFFKAKDHNSRSIWQVNQIRNKRIRSCRNTIIMVLDSQISILNFVNWDKASFMEKLNFPDIKPVPRGRGRMPGGISIHAKSFNIFVLLTCTLDGRNKLWEYQKTQGQSRVYERKKYMLNQIITNISIYYFQSINRVDRYICLQLIFKSSANCNFYGCCESWDQ